MAVDNVYVSLDKPSLIKISSSLILIMNLVYFHQHFSTPSGGTGTRSYEFAKKLVERGHQVTIVCGSFDVGNTGLSSQFSDGRRQGSVDGINVVEYELHYSNKLSFLQRAKQFLKFSIKCCKEVNRIKPDLVFCTSTPLTISLPGIYAKLFKRIPFVFEVRDLWPELPKAMGVITNPVILTLMKVLEVVSYKLANHVVALSEGMAKGVKEYVSEDKVSVISNGCDLYLAERPEKETFPLPAEVKQGDFVAIYGGTIGLANGVDALLGVAKALEDKGAARIKLLVVGNGMLKPSIESEAQKQNLKNLIFLDNCPKTALFSLYEQCDVGLMLLKDIPAFYDGTSPNKFFDYISIGLPVICNYSGWVNRLIGEANIGQVVPAGESELFADKLIEMSENSDRLTLNSVNAKKLAENSFSRESLSSEFVKIIEEFS